MRAGIVETQRAHARRQRSLTACYAWHGQPERASRSRSLAAALASTSRISWARRSGGVPRPMCSSTLLRQDPGPDDGGDVRFGVRNTSITGVTGDQPVLAFTNPPGDPLRLRGGRRRVTGYCRQLIPADQRQQYFREYPFAWFGIPSSERCRRIRVLAERPTPPSTRRDLRRRRIPNTIPERADQREYRASRAPRADALPVRSCPLRPAQHHRAWVRPAEAIARDRHSLRQVRLLYILAQSCWSPPSSTANEIREPRHRIRLVARVKFGCC